MSARFVCLRCHSAKLIYKDGIVSNQAMNESESILILAERRSLQTTSCLTRRRALVNLHVNVFEDHVIEGLSGGNERKAWRPSDADVEEDGLIGVVKEELAHLFFNLVFAIGR